MQAKRILLVTHDDVLRLTRRVLLKGEDILIDEASSDANAVSMLRAGRYDLVLIGRDARDEVVPLDERIDGMRAGIPVLKIDDCQSPHAQVIGTDPETLLLEVRKALSRSRVRS